jgi:hypothetical protein
VGRKPDAGIFRFAGIFPDLSGFCPASLAASLGSFPGIVAFPVVLEDAGVGFRGRTAPHGSRTAAR